MLFWLATAAANSNQFNFVNAHSSQAGFLCIKNAHDYGKPKWHLFSHSLSWKGNFGASTLSHKMCPRKQTTEPKLLVLVSFFSGYVTSYTNRSYGTHIIIVGSIPFLFFSGPPCIWVTVLIFFAGQRGGKIDTHLHFFYHHSSCCPIVKPYIYFLYLSLSL